MNKKLFSFLVLFFFTINIFCQNIPQSISTIEVQKRDITKSSEATEYEVVWFSPATKPGIVKKNDKLELGVKLPKSINFQINNYVNNKPLSKLNPFNPEDINIQAVFYKKENDKWVRVKNRFGFYYKNYIRNTNDLDPDDWFWQNKQTDYNFRIRFTPQEIGEWKCEISSFTKNSSSIKITEFQFKCISSNKKGFVKVSENNFKNLSLDEEGFFPIGLNLTKPTCYVELDKNKKVISDPYQCSEKNIDCAGIEDWCGRKKVGINTLLIYQKELEKLKKSGANYFRFLNMPHTYAIEYEKLGNYYDRMNRAWELDDLISKTEKLGLKMQYCISYGNEFRDPAVYSMVNWDWNAGPLKEDNGNCYKNELNLKSNVEFLTDSIAKKYYKNRLRYIVSRWGYSTGIGVIELQNEINGQFPNSDVGRYQWQDEMASYIKNDLESNHLVAVSYAGNPKKHIIKGDDSYSSPWVDVITFNYYNRPNYRKILKEQIDEYSNYKKPFLYAEIGISDDLAHCDNNIEWIKDIWITPFIGSAGMGLNWHEQHNYELWENYSLVQSFLSNLNLDKFSSIQYDRRNDRRAEMFCRVNKNENKAIGVISNTRWNFWTKGNGGDCNEKDDAFGLIPSFKKFKSVKYGSNLNKIKIKDLERREKYIIKWFNPGDNKMIKMKEVKSNYFGNLELEFPILDRAMPMVTFKVYPENVNVF